MSSTWWGLLTLLPVCCGYGPGHVFHSLYPFAEIRCPNHPASNVHSFLQYVQHRSSISNGFVNSVCSMYCIYPPAPGMVEKSMSSYCQLSHHFFSSSTAPDLLVCSLSASCFSLHIDSTSIKPQHESFSFNIVWQFKSLPLEFQLYWEKNTISYLSHIDISCGVNFATLKVFLHASCCVSHVCLTNRLFMFGSPEAARLVVTPVSQLTCHFAFPLIVSSSTPPCLSCITCLYWISGSDDDPFVSVLSYLDNRSVDVSR